MGTNIDHVGRVNLGAAPDRRPSLNTQAAINSYDYRFAAWEVIDGGDVKEVCRRLDVPGGPTVLGPKVAALRARLEACAKVGRPPPERPTQAPVSPLTNASASVGLESWRDKARAGVAFDATENASAKEMKGRALVTRSVEPSAGAAPAPLDEAPWRQALKLKVSAAAVKAVAEQEGKDPVKELRASGFAQDAERLRAEIEAAVLAAAVAEPEAPTLASAPRLSAEHPPIGRDFGFGLLAPLPLEVKPEGLLTSPPWFGAAGIFGPAADFTVVADGTPSAVAQAAAPRPAHMRSYVSIAGNGEDIPTPTEIAAADAEAEALWEQRHSEETVLAAQAEHARQRALLQQLGEEEESVEAETDAPAPPPTPPPTRPAPKVPVARGRSLQTLAASAKTPVVKKLRTARPAASAPAPSASAAPKARPQVTAPPVRLLPLPTWPEKAKAAPSDPPPKRDRSRHRKVAPKPPEPAQSVLLGMSPETTTPTSIGRSKRRKVPTPTPVVVAPAPPKRHRGPARQPAEFVPSLPAEVRARTTPEVQELLLLALKVCGESRAGVQMVREHYLEGAAAKDAQADYRLKHDSQDWSPSHRRNVSRRITAASRAKAEPIDLQERERQVLANVAAARACPPFPGLSRHDWDRQLNFVLNGTLTVARWNRELGLGGKTLINGWLARHGVQCMLFPDLLGFKGRRNHGAPPPATSEVGRMFGAGLRQLRGRYALTQVELAVALDVPTHAIPAIEQGSFAPRAALVTRAAAFFQVPWRAMLPADSEAHLLRLLIEGVDNSTRSFACGDLLRRVVLPDYGLTAHTPTPTEVSRYRRRDKRSRDCVVTHAKG